MSNEGLVTAKQVTGRDFLQSLKNRDEVMGMMPSASSRDERGEMDVRDARLGRYRSPDQQRGVGPHEMTLEIRSEIAELVKTVYRQAREIQDLRRMVMFLVEQVGQSPSS